MKTRSTRFKAVDTPRVSSMKYGALGGIIISFGIIGLFLWSNNYETAFVVLWAIVIFVGVLFLSGTIICMKCSNT